MLRGIVRGGGSVTATEVRLDFADRNPAGSRRNDADEIRAELVVGDVLDPMHVGPVSGYKVAVLHAPFLLVILLLLAGCASGPQIPKEIRVPVPVSCIDQAPVKPSMLSDAELLALDDYALVIALARDRRVRQGWEAVLEATIAGCR